MDYKDDAIYTYWVQYTTKNNESSFRMFIRGFVSIWEQKLDLKWANTDICLPSVINPDEGPSLSRLPDELLPAIAKFLYIAKDNAEKSEFSKEKIGEAEYLLRSLIVISKNFYNIPLLSSCDYVKESTSVAINIIHKLTSESNQYDESTAFSLVSFCHTLCHFLECLYDPYQVWRCFDSSQMNKLDISKLQYSPSMLHVEVVPFIFDCFETNVAIKYPLLAADVLNIFGAIVCGSQHNALRGVSPPTCSLIMKVISGKSIPLIVKTTALRCFVTVTQVMIQFPPHQCQLDVSTQIECLRDTLKECTTEEINIPLVLSIIKAIGQSIELSGVNAEKIQKYVVECKLLEIILNIICNLEVAIKVDDVVKCVETVSSILRMSNEAKLQMLIINGYEKIFEFVEKQKNKSQKLLKAIISIATENTDKTLDQNLENPQIIVLLIEWLPSIEEVDQVWLASVIFNLCTTNLQSICHSSNCNIIESVCKCLENSNQLVPKTVHQLLKLIENLASHSISTTELKKIFLLLRDKEELFPYTTQILSTLSEVAYSINVFNCKVFFDIQKDYEGLTINELKKWPGPMNGLTFHCWLRLDNVSSHLCSSTHGLASYRRQLLHLATNTNSGMEIFVGSDWTLIVGINTKKEFLTITARDFRFVENRWYCIDVCYSPPKRPFGHNQVSIYIDGMQNICAPAKFTPLTEQFNQCSIGTFLPQLPKTIEFPQQNERGILPSFITQVPNYLLMRSTSAMDPYIKDFPPGMQDSLYGRAMCLKGQLGPICLFPEYLSSHQVKVFYELGPNYTSLNTMDDSTSDVIGMFNKSVFYYSPTAASSREVALDLSQKNKVNAHLTSSVYKCSSIQDVINMIGGLYVLFPVLESNILNESDFGLLSLDQSNMELSVDIEDFSSLRSFSLDDTLELHPIGLLLILMKNLMKGNIVGQEQLLRKNGIPILGELLTNVPPDKIDLQMLEALQLFMETLQDISNVQLLRAFFQHVLFNFAIWSRCSFQIQIGAVKIIYLLIKNDRKSFRKRFGIQFFLDSIRIYYTTCDVLSTKHTTVLRSSLLDIIRFYIQKEVTISDVDIIIRYLITCKSETMIVELLDVLIKYLDSDLCKDQLYLIMYEPQIAELLYSLLIEKSISMLAKKHVLKLFSVLLNTKHVYERHKCNLRLQNSGYGLYPGLISLLPEFQNLSMELIMMMLDQILMTDSLSTYTSILSVLHRLAYEDIDVKLEAARKILTIIYMNPKAAKAIAKQAGWQDCVTRLLVHRLAEGKSTHHHDLMSFDDHDNPKMYKKIKKCRSYPNVLKTKNLSLRRCNSMFELKRELYSDKSERSLIPTVYSLAYAANLIENEIKGVAGSVSAVVVDNFQYATENLSSAVNTVGLVVSDNIQTASDNLAFAMNSVSGNIHSATSNLSSAVTSAYSILKQKTTEIQEIGENAKERLKKYAMYSPPSDRNIIYEDKVQLMTKQLLVELGLEADTYSISNRSMSSSLEDISSIKSSIALDNNSISSGIAMSDNVLTVFEDIDNKVQDDFDNVSPWQELTNNKSDNKEKDLCSFVENILFVVMWRGVNIHNNNCWKERGQVMACINMISLNNMLYCSHLELKLHILEKAVEAVLSDFYDSGSTLECDHAKTENISQLFGLVYDLVVLDPSPNFDKKCSVKLLDGCIKLIESLAVFSDDQEQNSKDIVMKVYGILLSCSSSSNMDICAMATVKLHTILQTNNKSVVEIECYLLRSVNTILQKSLLDENLERYSFILPLIKTLITKLSEPLNISTTELPYLTEVLYSGQFYDRFFTYCKTSEWITFIENKVSELCKEYRRSMNTEITESMNTFWAECYESYKYALDVRNRLVADSRKAFQNAIVEPYKIKKEEEESRIFLIENQRKAQRLLVKAKWKQIKGYLCGERGPWKSRSISEKHWILSQHENYSRMRLKLCPNYHFDDHKNASNLRDNAGNAVKCIMDCSEIPPSMPQAAVRSLVEEDGEMLPDENIASYKTNYPEDDNERKEKHVLSVDCQLVTLMSVIKGRLVITTTHAYFYDLTPITEDCDRHDFKWSMTKLRDVYLRRYNLRRSALEFFLMDQSNYFLNFTTKIRLKVLTAIFSIHPPNFSFNSSRHPQDLLKKSNMTQKWVNREISNFEYLMQLNTIAGRTYNDLSQYPVFPWVLADYTSEELDLNNPKTFRDLSRPVGVVNPNNEADVQAKYRNFEDPHGVIGKFHYGTHYSNSAGVLHYLVRVEPYTSLHIELQSGRFDVADRQFHSIAQTWKLLMDTPNDVKELIPEFFYFPEFLKNMNNFDLGRLQSSKERIGDVILPPWADSPEDFIYKHRKALESEYVSSHLHEWIDLIFGYKQKGQAAVDAMNVFYYCSYEGAVDLDAISDPIEREALEGMINNFGQTPSQLLREPHPSRLPLDKALERMMKSDSKKPDLTMMLKELSTFYVEITDSRYPMVFLSPPRSGPKGLLQTFMTDDTLVTVCENTLIGRHSWLPYDKHSNKGFTLDVDPSHILLKNKKDPNAYPMRSSSYHPSIEINSHLFAVSHDAKYLFTAGHWDYSVKTFSFSRNKYLSSVIRHFDIVTCIALDSCGWYMISGSRDCTSVVWDVSNTNNVNPKPFQTLLGHDLPVTCVAIATELDMAVSGSEDGTVNVYSIHQGLLVHCLIPLGCVCPPSTISYVTISFQGHIAFSAKDKECHSVHVFSCNGDNLGSKYVGAPVTGITTIGDCLVVVDDAGYLTLSRLLGLHPVYDVPLDIPIQTVVATPGNTHLLAPLRDGNIAVIGLPNSNN
ncbi:neurobeachin-like protein 2 [Daktulosphaira vitifoliae]|uniref:neurobeachin-like protein 2 n=1 Tax=Daktulosphaira vitifoliae TaxID=58002 RepID=UPI0021A9E80B|nr:neurobeachin-like protein 2 [Daktulosphaira vitifoliae]